MTEKSSVLKNHFLSATSGMLAGATGIFIGVAAAGGLFIRPEITLTAMFAGLAAMGGSLALNMGGKMDLKPATYVLAAVVGFSPMIVARPMVAEAVKHTFETGRENAQKYQSQSDFCRSRVYQDGWKVFCR